MAMSNENGHEAENMAAWLTEKNTLLIRPFPLPNLGNHQVKIQVKAVGICGSDVHYYRHLRCADFIVKEPMVIGHECAGVVVEVGSNVEHLKIGDRVALEPGISCSHCEFCKEGRYNLCPEMKFFATPPVHGSLANYVIHPADLCFKLPENVSLEEGAMCEPLSVGVHACRRANVGPDTHVLVTGAGPIGLVTMLVAKAFGAPRVIVTDIDEQRLSIAKKLGADATYNVSTNNEDLQVEIESLIDVAIDCVGVETTMRTALQSTKAGGKVCLVGMGQSEMKLPITNAAATREVDVLGVFRYRNTYPLCIDLISTGRLNVKTLITHRYGFSQQDLVDAFETSAKGGNAIKVMFNL